MRSGAITLNAGVGGLNALAVEIAARGGARIVWLPTVDAENEASEGGPKPAKQPVWRQIQDEFAAAGVASRAGAADGERPGGRARRRRTARPRAGDRAPRPSRDPRRRRGGAGRGRQHVLVTHPDYPTQGVPVGEQRDLAARGAVLERCFAPIHTGKVTWDATFAAIRATGVAHNVLSTDLGQVANPPVEDGLALMADRLLAAGFSEEDVRTMAVANTRRLAGVLRRSSSSARTPPTSSGGLPARSRRSSRAAARRTSSRSPTASGGSRASSGRSRARARLASRRSATARR